jgi:hypothetical protein
MNRCVDFPRKPRVRYFDFEPTTHLLEAMRVIVEALEDEGLTLSDNDNATASKITTVLIDGHKRVVVPTQRIVRIDRQGLDR